MSKIFEAAMIGTARIPNRLVRSATWEGMGNPDGTVSDRLVALYSSLAVGGVGLITTSHAYVNPTGQAGPWQLSIHRDRMIEGLAQAIEAANAGGAQVFVQLAHAGAHAATKLTRTEAIGPSAIAGRFGGTSRAMSKGEIQSLVEDMAAGARRARAAGAAGVQIHAAHGYLLSQFLSPRTNERQDEYGGSIAARARILMEVVDGVRVEVGPGFPVTVKLNSQDFLAGGFSSEEMLATAKLLEERDIAALELSGGTLLNPEHTHSSRKVNPLTPDEEVYYQPEARAFKASVKTPLILVGGIRSPGVAASLLDTGAADFVSLCRPLISQPDLPNRWKNGDTEKARCVSCNRCYEPLVAGEGVGCPVFNNVP